MTATFYNFSGGMESAAMLVVDRERIRDLGAVVRFADTGKHFPEMADSLAQIADVLDIQIVTVPRRITFDEYLFEKGGMLRKGMNDCSRRMKRGNLSRHAATFPKPWEIDLGFNADEDERAAAFTERNERPWCHWRFPLLEAGVTREASWDICRRAGFTILVDVYARMGRFDCYWCPNQTPAQALKVLAQYPALAADWMAAEAKKGHSFLSVPLRLLPMAEQQKYDAKRPLFACACFGGDEDAWEDERTADELTKDRHHPHCPVCREPLEDCRCESPDSSLPESPR